VGLFINTLPLRISLKPEATVSGWLQELQVRQTELVEYQYSSMVDIQGWSELPPGATLFENNFVFENYPSEMPKAAELSVTIEDFHGVERFHYPLSLQFAAVAEGDGGASRGQGWRTGVGERRGAAAVAGGIEQHGTGVSAGALCA
jgi:non-ribosomal peptide synthetase component F